MIQHTQSHCRQCGRLTMHQRSLPQAPHGLYVALALLAVVACWPVAALVLVAWISHGIALLFAAPSYRCSQCGQSMGALNAAERAVERQAENQAIEERARRTGRVARRIGQELRAMTRDLATIATGMAAGAWRSSRSLPGRVDRLLARLAGEGEPLHHFLRLLVIAAIALAAAWCCLVRYW